MFLQPDAPDVLALRRALDQILSPYLGSFSDGRKGLWVESSRLNLSPASAKGVICIISRDKTPGNSKPAGVQTSRQFFWEVSLTNYGSSAGDRTGKNASQIEAIEASYDLNMDQAILAMQTGFPSQRERLSPHSADSYRRTTFLLQYHELLN